MIKVIGINGSPRKDKNTQYLLELALKSVQDKDPRIQTQSIPLGGLSFSGCVSCDYCKSNFSCSQQDDLHPILEMLKDREIRGFIIASPVYMGGMTSQCKAFLDRTVLFRRNGFYFKDKVAGAITVGGSKNGGQDLALVNILSACMIHDMIVVPDASPTSHFGGSAWEKVPAGLANDELALSTVRNLGSRVADMIGKLSF